jgi:hypothetical protein
LWKAAKEEEMRIPWKEGSEELSKAPRARGFLLERRMLVIFYFFLHFVTTESRFARSQSFRIRSGPIHNSPLLLALHMTFRCRSKVARFQDPLQAWMSMKLKTGNTTHSPTIMMSKRGKETFSVCSCLSPLPAEPASRPAGRLWQHVVRVEREESSKQLDHDATASIKVKRNVSKETWAVN